jgi:hypothetical protein
MMSRSSTWYSGVIRRSDWPRCTTMCAVIGARALGRSPGAAAGVETSGRSPHAARREPLPITNAAINALYRFIEAAPSHQSDFTGTLMPVHGVDRRESGATRSSAGAGDAHEDLGAADEAAP